MYVQYLQIFVSIHLPLCGVCMYIHTCAYVHSYVPVHMYNTCVPTVLFVYIRMYVCTYASVVL